MIYPSAKISKRTVIRHSDNWHIGDFCLISVPELIIGKGSHINAGTKIVGRGKVTIGEYSVIGYDAKLITSTDTPEGRMSDYAPEEERKILVGDINIGNEVFIGSNSIIMPGVTIGNGAVIGANSYIDKDVEPWTINICGRIEKRRIDNVGSQDRANIGKD